MRYEHRDAVNFLATRFIAEKWLHPDAADVIEAEKDLPPDRFPAETKLVKISSVLSA